MRRALRYACRKMFWRRRGNSVTLGRAAEALDHHERHRVPACEIGSRWSEAYALHTLGTIAEDEGDEREAMRLFADALALRRELGEQMNVAETLVSLGRLEGGRGDVERATTHLDDALATFAEHGENAGHLDVIEARFRLRELTKDDAQLVEADRMLSDLRDHAPADQIHHWPQHQPA
ncbi:MAG: tetratricopeptide repeat protein [Planctomycetota bacterium]|jgi:tetratricopeptide (TPR) repeat protein